MKKLLLLAIVVLGISAVSFGQDNVVATSASATIIEKLTISENAKLDFGTIASNSIKTEVTVAPSLEATRTGTADVIASDKATAGKFTVTGKDNTTFSISFSDNVTLVGGEGGAPMTVNAFTASTGLTGVSTGTSDVSFYVGATLTINANQKDGEYSGDYNVTVLYE